MSQESLAIRVPCHLPARQQQVLRLLGSGYTTEAIAAELKISAKTVALHRMELMRRVKLWNYQDLTKLALRLGLTEINV